MRIRTNYQMNDANDVMAATDLCNAMVTSIEEEGLLISVTGIITEGVTNVDGSVETAESPRERITASESWKAGYPSKFCVARVLFTGVESEMRAAGWAQKYDDVFPNPAKTFEDNNWAQDGDIFFVDQ